MSLETDGPEPAGTGLGIGKTYMAYIFLAVGRTLGIENSWMN